VIRGSEHPHNPPGTSRGAKAPPLHGIKPRSLVGSSELVWWTWHLVVIGAQRREDDIGEAPTQQPDGFGATLPAASAVPACAGHSGVYCASGKPQRDDCGD
jgi:hypothetical protein